MLKTHHFVLGAYQTNCFAIREASSKSCCIIDPGYRAEVILDYLDQEGLQLEAILLTHGHFDHVGAVKDLVAETGCRVFIHPAELQLPPMFTAGKLYYTDTYAEGSQLNLAGLSIHVLHTPGHTSGSVCLLVDNFLFSGDTLFADSCGRTDIGGSWTDLQASLQRLKNMEADLTVFPGHGQSTTLAWEKRYNPYMR